jgi:hypothetical protein
MQHAAMTRSAPRWLQRLASPWFTVAFFVLLAASGLAVIKADVAATWAVMPPLALLCLNLVAGIATHPRFRSDLPLLIFHFALLALVALVVGARLTYFEARTSLVVGNEFDGDLQMVEHGPLHGNGVARLRFANEGLIENLSLDSKYAAPYSRVGWTADDGVAYQAEIGDDHPLRLDGYRIYTTRNRGFAPIFAWQPAGGEIEYGSVQLRDKGQGGFTPDAGWHLPKGPEMWAMVELETGEANVESKRPAAWRVNLNADRLAHRLVVRINEARYPLRPGESIELPTGRLTYLELKSWMGYRISYDPTIPWLIATIATAISSLIWFYARLFFRRRQIVGARNLPSRIMQEERQ